MDWKRGEVASEANRFCLLKTALRVKFLLGWGWGLGAPWLDGPSAFVHRPEPCPPSIRKRCACGFPQGTAEPLRHASNNGASPPRP